MLLVLGAMTALAIFLVTRTPWRPVAPLRLGRRRSWGQILSASTRMYVARAPLFLGIGLLLIPLGVVISIVQGLVLGGFGLAGVDTTGEGAGWLVLLLVSIGTTLALLGLALVQAATVCALAEIDAGRPIRPFQAYRIALRRLRPLLGGLVVAAAAWVALGATAFLLPVAVWLAVRWSLLAQVVELEEPHALGALRRSGRLVRRHWLRVGSLVGVSAVLALAAGPLLGAILILLTEAPLALMNVFAGVVYAIAMPLVALVTSYVYFDVRSRHELETAIEPRELPAEIELGR
jgi:hypothetical protein